MFKHWLDIIITAAGFAFEPTEANPCEDRYLLGEDVGFANGQARGYTEGFDDGHNLMDVTHQLEIELLEKQIQHLSGDATTVHVDPPLGGEDADSIQSDYQLPIPILPGVDPSPTQSAE